MDLTLPRHCYDLKLWSDGVVEITPTVAFEHWAEEVLCSTWRVVPGAYGSACLRCDDLTDAVIAYLTWG